MFARLRPLLDVTGTCRLRASDPTTPLVTEPDRECGSGSLPPCGEIAWWGSAKYTDIGGGRARLKRERGIELLMKERRLRRWRADNTPGDLDPLELGPVARDGLVGPDLTNADQCMPIPNSEREENENLPVL